MVVSIPTPVDTFIVKHTLVKHAHEQIGRVHQMCHLPNNKKGVLIYGKSGEGKTYIAECYAAQFPPVKEVDHIRLPIFTYRFQEAKSKVDDILRLLITELGVQPPIGKVAAGELDKQFRFLIKTRGVELIILDEIQQVFPAKQGKIALDMLKYFCALLDTLTCSIVFIGSERAMRLLTFGEVDKTVDDNEQLSRRMLRSVKLHRILPRTQEWVDCINSFLQQISAPQIGIEDKELLDRLYVAYMERSFSTLDGLFMLEDMSHIKDRHTLMMRLKANFYIYSQNVNNPFDESEYSYRAIDAAVTHEYQKLKRELKTCL